MVSTSRTLLLTSKPCCDLGSFDKVAVFAYCIKLCKVVIFRTLPIEQNFQKRVKLFIVLIVVLGVNLLFDA